MRMPWILIIAAALTAIAFWLIDFPQTVRVKAAILKLLPLNAKYLNDSIKALCAGAHSGKDASTCYVAFYSREAADEASRRKKCQEFSASLAANQEEDWQAPPNDDDILGYAYMGSDPKVWEEFGLLYFQPKTCTFLSTKGGLKEHPFKP
jgi:hypothetical protein